MKLTVLHALLICASLLFGKCVSAQDNGLSMFDESYVHEVRIYFNQQYYWDSLSSHYYQSGGMDSNKYLMGNVLIDGTTIDSVGVRHKGFSSMVNVQNKKKPFKIDFPEFVSGKRYDGLKKIHLNNGYLDPTFMHDALSFKLMRMNGVPAPRTSFANLYINDTLIGLYTLVEQVDNKFLKNWFNDNDGDLFKCNTNTYLEWYNMDTILYSYELKPKNKDKNPDWKYIDAFIYSFNFPNANIVDSLTKYLNLDNFLTCMAIDQIVNNVDNYVFSGNNFYLYLNPDSYKYEWIPWDYNLSFNTFPSELTPNFQCSGQSGVYDCQYLMMAILDNPSLRNQYLTTVCDLIHQMDTTDIVDYISEMKALISSHVTNDSLKFYPNVSDFSSSTEYGNITVTNINGQNMNMIGLKGFFDYRFDILIDKLNNDNQLCFLDLDLHVLNNISLNIFPNPASNIINVNLSSGKNLSFSGSIQLIDLSGKIVWSVDIDSLENESHLTINISDLKSGAYFMQVTSENRMVVVDVIFKI